MDIKESFLSKVDQAHSALSNSPVVKGLVDGGLSLIPFFGQAITSALDTRAFQLFEKNSKKFAQEVRDLVSRIEEDRIDRKFVESDEFVSLLTEILARNARTHEQEKVKLFAQILENRQRPKHRARPIRKAFFALSMNSAWITFGP